MEQISILEAENLAYTYFKELIENHRRDGYQTKIVELEKNEENNPYYIEFSKSDNSSKYYKIIA